MEIAYGVIAALAITIVIIGAIGVRRDRRLARALRNYTIQVGQITQLFTQMGMAADRAAENIREFGEAWAPEVIEAAKEKS